MPYSPNADEVRPLNRHKMVQLKKRADHLAKRIANSDVELHFDKAELAALQNVIGLVILHRLCTSEAAEEWRGLRT